MTFVAVRPVKRGGASRSEAVGLARSPPPSPRYRAALPRYTGEMGT